MIIGDRGRQVANGDTIGPFKEDDPFTVLCVATGGNSMEIRDPFTVLCVATGGNSMVIRDPFTVLCVATGGNSRER